MTQPVELSLSPEQDEMYVALRAQAQAAQHDLDLFCAAVFRGKGLLLVYNVQRLQAGQLVGEIRD